MSKDAKDVKDVSASASASASVFETIGNRCALCALEPRLEAISSRFGHGLRWQEVFDIGFFLGRYLHGEANYCADHKRFMQDRVPRDLAKVGIVMAESAKKVVV